MIDPNLQAEFEKWYVAQIADDQEFELRHMTPFQFLIWSESRGFLDKVLMLPQGEMSLREWWSINVVPSDAGNPFPDVRRVGGDHDRGFSPALNQEMRGRIQKANRRDS